MFEFALIFSLGFFIDWNWSFAFCLFMLISLNQEFSSALSILSVVNVFLIVFTIFNVDPYEIPPLVALYRVYNWQYTFIGILFYVWKKLLNHTFINIKTKRKE